MKKRRFAVRCYLERYGYTEESFFLAASRAQLERALEHERFDYDSIEEVSYKEGDDVTFNLCSTGTDIQACIQIA